MTAFSSEVVAAVCRHLDDDHAADTLLIARALGGCPGAEAARAVGVDSAALHLLATVDGVERPVAVAFPFPVTERPQIRVAVVALYERACARSGGAPRTHGRSPA